MNEVVPWSTRARGSIVAAGRRVGRLVSSRWTAFTDLGVGAVFLSLGVVVAAGIGVAVFEGRNGKDPVPCDQASTYVATIEHLGHSGKLTAAEVDQLQQDSSDLTAIAAHAHGGEATAITDAATTAGSATAGQKLDTAQLTLHFDAACTFSGHGGGGSDRH